MTRQAVGVDTETFLIESGCVDPKIVCMSLATGDDKQLINAKLSPQVARTLLENEQLDLIFQNGAFDLGVLIRADPTLIGPIFKALDAGRIKDTMIREKLIRLKHGELKFKAGKRSTYSLASLVEQYLKIDISATKGEDAWRLRYNELIDVPLKNWPRAASEYALNDAVYTLRVYECQGGPIVNEDEQVRAAFALHLMSIRGIKTDLESVEQLRRSLTPKIDKLNEILTGAGILRPPKNGKRAKNMKVLRSLISEAYEQIGETPPLTPTGAIQTSREVLINSGNEVLKSLGELSNAQKLLTTYVPTLEEGIVNPGYSILMESGRTSSFRPNIQNVPRMGGVRECYVPRAGYVFIACDYSTLELAALSQVCLDLFGASKMGEAINNGEDLHQALADEAGCSRQVAKAANFGYPGGMGASSFQKFASAYGVELSEDEASRLKHNWLKRWPVMQRYFNRMGRLAGERDSFRVIQLRSNRIRGGCHYTAGCNTLFQGLAADGAKLACYEVARRCYVDESSPLYGSHSVAFIHDEIILEAPIDGWREAAAELSKVMVESMNVFIPDILIKAQPAGMTRWYKGAEEVRDEHGTLQLWEPDE